MWWWVQAALIPAGLLSAGITGWVHAVGTDAGWRQPDADYTQPQRSLHRQDAVGKHPGTSFDATPLFVTPQQGLVLAGPRAGDGCHLLVSNQASRQTEMGLKTWSKLQAGFDVACMNLSAAASWALCYSSS